MTQAEINVLTRLRSAKDGCVRNDWLSRSCPWHVVLSQRFPEKFINRSSLNNVFIWWVSY